MQLKNVKKLCFYSVTKHIIEQRNCGTVDYIIA